MVRRPVPLRLELPEAAKKRVESMRKSPTDNAKRSIEAHSVLGTSFPLVAGLVTEMEDRG
jgi:hypothetical protein